jgi:hypothetical protein
VVPEFLIFNFAFLIPRSGTSDKDDYAQQIALSESCEVTVVHESEKSFGQIETYFNTTCLT